jgi:alkyl sulfatase BDS1-like metallo-beta-lactamase superfamily hydrolase
MIDRMKVLIVAACIGFTAAAAAAELDPNKHFDPLGKPPSDHTLKAIAEDAAGLPFDDVRDFAEAEKGFIAEPDSWIVKGPAMSCGICTATTSSAATPTSPACIPRCSVSHG